MLSELLEDAGFEPIISPHGARSYSHIRENRPDLVLLDVQMEGLNGVAVYHVLHRDPLTMDIPVVFITGNITWLRKLLPRYEERNIAAIEKPFDLDEVIEVIHSLLAKQLHR